MSHLIKSYAVCKFSFFRLLKGNIPLIAQHLFQYFCVLNMLDSDFLVSCLHVSNLGKMKQESTAGFTLWDLLPPP